MLESLPSATVPLTVNDRYEIQDAPIGQGGMGVVYKAYDTATRRHVALKTMPGSVDSAAIDMFEREWEVLGRISHPNIVDILDSGKFTQDGQTRPYFVMPLLRGETLDQLIKHSSERLTVDGVVDIIAQVCRGLQAAHDQNLVHRDIKPSNIFVMDDNTIKIIDFGIAHLADARSVTGMKGTLQYMAPEQLEMKPPTPLSDIFSLGVVCYEALTGRRPFARKTEGEVVEAIRSYVPPPATEVNNAVNQMVSRTVHKAMAKQSWHRFSNAREFGDTLQRALRNEPIERFDKSKIQPRIDRIKKAQGEGDYQFAGEILTELESEGHIDPDMSMLRVQIDQTSRQRNIRQLLESARTRIEEDELPLALQKIGSVLEIDPVNPDALALKAQVERQRSDKQIENWFRVVRQHIDNQDYSQARQGIGEILKINSAETRARELLSTIDRTETELIKVREEKQKLYDAALDSYRKGEISTALGKLERLLEINRTGPRSSNPERDAQYQSLYNQVRSEHDAVRNAYGEARRHLVEKNFARALEICDESLAKHPDDPLFMALKLEAQESQRQQQSANVAEINRRVEAEPDLEKKVSILSDAVAKYPDEPLFKSSLELVRGRRDLINSIVARAQQYEERGQLNDAAGQWDILKNIYPKYPGLDFELERLARRRADQARNDTKALWVEQIDRHLGLGESAKAQEVLKQASLEFPNDAELQELQAVVQGSIKRSGEADTLVSSGQILLAQGKHEEGLAALREAERLDERNPATRAALMSAVLKRARELMLTDWRAAEPLVQEASDLDAGDPVARSLSTLIDDYKKQDSVGRFVVEARTLQASGDLSGAMRKVESGLSAYPNEIRLSQLYNTLRSASSETRRKEATPILPVESLDQSKALKPDLPKSAQRPTPPSAIESPLAHADPLGLPTAVHTTFQAMPTAAVTSPTPVESAMLSAASASALPPSVVPPSLPADPVVETPHDASGTTATANTTPVVGKDPSRPLLLWGAAAAAVLVVSAAMLLRPGHPKPVVAPVPGNVPVQFTANVGGAHFTLDNTSVSDSQGLTVKPGVHKAEAALEGYTSDFKDFTVPKGKAETVVLAFHLQPLLPELRVTSDLKAGHYVLDGVAPADLQDGSLVRESVAAGSHRLAILDGSRPVFALNFTVQPKEAATLSEPLSGKLSSGLVVSSLGGRAKVYGTPGSKGGADGQPLGVIPPEGIAIPLTAHQVSRFVVDDGKGKPRTIPIDFSPLPVLSVFLSGAAERIPVIINANVQDGFVSLNGVLLKKQMADGTRTVLLAPGSYKVKVTRDGFKEAPEQVVVLKSGDSNLQPLQFLLAEIPQLSTLSVEGAPAGAEVSIDGTREGTTGTAGTFSTEVGVGNHVVLVHKSNYDDFKEAHEFRVGAPVHISVIGMKGPGIVNFKVVPQNATISYHRDGDATTTEVDNNHALDLRAGTYEISAEAENCVPKKDLLIVASGKIYDISWTLKPKTFTQPPSTFHTPSDTFENGPSWVVSNGLWVHGGKGISFTKRREGTFNFDIVNPKDSKELAGNKMKKITFVADYNGPEDQVVYTIDTHKIVRKVFINGKAQNISESQTAMSDRTLRISVEIGPTTVTIRNRFGKILDSIKRGSTPGRFGLVDEVAILPQN